MFHIFQFFPSPVEILHTKWIQMDMNQNKIPTTVNLFATSDSSHHPTTNSISMLGLAAVVCCIMSNKIRTDSTPKPSQISDTKILCGGCVIFWRRLLQRCHKEKAVEIQNFLSLHVVVCQKTDQRDQRHRSSVVQR